jgi:hypothetical protein
MPNVVIDFAPPGSRGTGAAAFARVTRGTSVTGGGAEDVYGDTSTVRASEESSYAEAEAEEEGASALAEVGRTRCADAPATSPTGSEGGRSLSRRGEGVD